MPRYIFHCKNCNTDKIIDKKMSEYNPNEQCDVCNNQMERKVEDLLPQNYIVNCSGFYGKKSN